MDRRIVRLAARQIPKPTAVLLLVVVARPEVLGRTLARREPVWTQLGEWMAVLPFAHAQLVVQHNDF